MGKSEPAKKGSPRLWSWVILAFVILIIAWTTLIIVAANNQPELIELQTPRGN